MRDKPDPCLAEAIGMDSPLPSIVGRTVFIAGGCGTVGSGLTRVFLQNGARVAVSSRSQERLDELRKSVDKVYQPNLIGIKEDISTEAGAKNALDILDRQGGVQHVVATLGSWWREGPLSKQSVEVFDKVMHDRAKSHFICAKTFLPYLANIEGSTYTFISGAAAEKCRFPDISMIVVSGGCLYGISEAARAEFKDSKVAVNEVRIGIFILPKLDKDLEQRTKSLEGSPLDVIGNDVIGDFMLSVLKARAKGIIKIYKRTDIEENKKQLL